MTKQAPAPLCLHCGEDKYAAVESRKVGNDVHWFCNTCSWGWVVKGESAQ